MELATQSLMAAKVPGLLPVSQVVSYLDRLGMYHHSEFHGKRLFFSSTSRSSRKSKKKRGEFLYSIIPMISHNRVWFYTIGWVCLHKKGSVKTLILLFFCEKGSFSLKSPCFTANKWSIQCQKSPYFIVKRVQNLKFRKKKGDFQFWERGWVPTFDGTDTTKACIRYGRHTIRQPVISTCDVQTFMSSRSCMTFKWPWSYDLKV